MLRAEYLNGYKEDVTLRKCSKEEISQWIGLMKGRSGGQIMRLRKEWHTDTPSIQGVWHPFLFKDTKLNITDIKDKSLSQYISPYKSASDRLKELQESQQNQSDNNKTE
ncbi:large ribosomal subunit protein mL43-like [Ruditapes philippinarum]|uniref:large ribosomal subunit protein mL43-like n=1 Tax=Ruditapes philippinarum TaxID=129788 RepID=UPI00295B3D7F|nr:large ribosomal subunit protein mL43-like [Ruditapes philippinarum]